MNEEQRKKTINAIMNFVEKYFSDDAQKDPAMVAAIAGLLNQLFQNSK